MLRCNTYARTPAGVCGRVRGREAPHQTIKKAKENFQKF
jgi:hypothetical protein